MLVTMLLLLTAGPDYTPSWNPYRSDPEAVRQFKQGLEKMDKEDRPDPNSDPEKNCYFASYLMSLGTHLMKFKTTYQAGLGALTIAKDYYDRNCRPNRPLHDKITKAVTKLEARRGRLSREQPSESQDDVPFCLPPLPDRAGGDLGAQLVPMFAVLEARLAAGGHALTGEARACAWASGGLSAAEAAQRAGAGTEGMTAGANVLTGRVATHCVGEALAQKEAAWKWLREHRATQPLVVPLRTPTPAWPATTASDGVFWAAVAVLVLGPEAWPILVTP